MHRIKSALGDGPRMFRNVADHKCFRLVTVPTVNNGRDIHIDDVAVLQNVGTGYAVADNFVDARTAAFGIAVVAERCRLMFMAKGVFVNQLVDFQGRYSSHNMRTQIVHQLGIEPTCTPHSIALGFRKLQFSVVLKHFQRVLAYLPESQFLIFRILTNQCILRNVFVQRSPLAKTNAQERGQRSKNIANGLANRNQVV